MKPTLTHRPGARAVIIGAMLLLLAVVLPGLVIAPENYANVGGLFGLAIFAAFELALLSFVLRRVDIDVTAERVTMTSYRWPLAARTEAAAVQDVADVVVAWHPRGRSVRLELVMTDGRRMPVTDSYFGPKAQTDADRVTLADAIGAAKG